MAGPGHAATRTEHHRPHVVPQSVLPELEPLTDAALAAVKPYSGAPIDVLTHHYDDYRTGWNQSEIDLTPASVSSGSFGLLKRLAVDGNVLAQPLIVSGFVMPNGTKHDVLVVVTGHDSVYAYDAATYALLWQVSLGTPQSSSDVGCGDVVPEYGIDSTPVIVRSAANAARLYVVAATEPSPGQFRHMLHALELGTGKDLVTPVTIAPKAVLSDGSVLAFDPQNQWVRTGLAYNNGTLYFGISSHCDANQNSISGWMLGYDGNLKLQYKFHTIQTPQGGNLELASIWMGGFAPAIDQSGNLFVVTGNGDYSNLEHDWGESALKLSPSLKVLDRFTAAGYANLNEWDMDFGSGGIMLMPTVAGQTAPPMAVAIGKNANLYLLNQTRLGGLLPNDRGALQMQNLGQFGIWGGGPAYYAGPAGPLVYVQTNSAPLTGFAASTGTTPGLTATLHGTIKAGYGGSAPIVSSNGSAAGTGVVWLVRRSSPVNLEAYDAVKLGAPLFRASVGYWSNTSDGNAYLTPLEANGRVYVGNYKTVSVFGLKQ
jgi:hypothetical protein